MISPDFIVEPEQSGAAATVMAVQVLMGFAVVVTTHLMYCVPAIFL